MEGIRIPHVEEALVQHLKSVFKDRLPRREKVDDDIRYMIGQQEVIQYLERLVEDQKQEDPLAGL